MIGMEGQASAGGGTGSAPPRPPVKVTLFEDLVVSNPRKRRQGLFVPGSVAGHVAVLALLILVPILWPETPPVAPDSVGVLVFNPPPAIALSLNKGSSLVEKKAEPQKTTPDPQAKKPEFTVPTEKPVEAELKPEQAAPESEVAGSETGTEHGSELGLEGGSDTGQIGGDLNGVEGGCVGCTGNGPVPDYDEAPKLIRGTKPQYPQEAFVKKIEGIVTVEFVIDEQGQVARPRVLKSIPMLDAAALACIRQWIFAPAKKGGRAVASIAQAPVTFRIF
jgi:periplasmic protein TonB